MLTASPIIVCFPLQTPSTPVNKALLHCPATQSGLLLIHSWYNEFLLDPVSLLCLLPLLFIFKNRRMPAFPHKPKYLQNDYFSPLKTSEPLLKIAFWLHPCLTFLLRSRMSFLMRIYSSIQKKLTSCTKDSKDVFFLNPRCFLSSLNEKRRALPGFSFFHNY